ncbi:MAG: hypothetical protein P4M04_03830 [Acidobacteriota bacterium]|nr:hypothetical protein [Acidobacteriota bacterium]
MACSRALRGILLSLLLAVGFVPGSTPAYAWTAPGLSAEGQQIAKVVSVRKVLRTPYFASRYPQIHYYTLYFSVRDSDQTYCAEYETAIVDEIDDLFSAKNQNVEIVLERKGLTLTTPAGRKIKAYFSEEKHC